MDDRKFATLINMGQTDRLVRLLGGGLLIFLGLFETLSDSSMINIIMVVFGATNAVASLFAICPAYLLANLSTCRPQRTNAIADKDSRTTDHIDPIANLRSETTLSSKDLINRNLLLSVTLPVSIVLLVFIYLFIELAESYRDESEISAARAIATMALHIETAGEESFPEYQSGGVIAIIFHDAYGNKIPTVLEKIPEDESLAQAIIASTDDLSLGPTAEITLENHRIIKTTESLPAQGLHVSVFYKITTDLLSETYPILSRLVFTVLLALWLSGWTARYIIRRYTGYVAKNAEAIRHRSTHDVLTGLPNRTGLEETLKQHFSDHSVEQSFAVFTIDIANFHYFNDTLGHDRGDKLLIAISDRLSQSIQGGESLARLNGDEFCILSDLETNRTSAVARAERLRAAICHPIVLDEIEINVDCNIGYSVYPDHSRNQHDLLRLSNIALHHTKNQSGHISGYNFSDDKDNAKNSVIITELQSAIRNNELHMVYQPRIHLQTGELHGVEALVRWKHPVYDYVPPTEFVDWAEKSGLINQLTKWVLREVHQQYDEWAARGMDIPIAVNLSPVNLEDESTFTTIIAAASHSYPVGCFLELELTENAVVKDADNALEKMRLLHNAGIPIAIDDFGTGLASFNYLRNFPARNLKIDRSFVNIENPDSHDLALIKSMIEIGHNLNMSVTAEGIESTDTLNMLIACGCDFAQGYHICRPVLPADVVAWIAEDNITLFNRQAAHNDSLSGPYRNAA